MLSPASAPETIEDEVDPDFDPNFRINPADYPDRFNMVISADGQRIESYDDEYGNHIVIPWNELLDDEDEEEIPHEQVMEEMRLYIAEMKARHGNGR
jgi:hypothetical protein